MKTKAMVKEINLNSQKRIINVYIDAKDSEYIEEPKEYGFPMLVNSAPLIEGFNYVLEFGHEAVNAMKGNKDFTELAITNRMLKNSIQDSMLAKRVKQFLSALEYDTLTDFQAKCVLLIENELKT